jgi:HSP20 family protein
MDNYQMGEEVHPGLVHPWQWQWRLFSLLSSPTLSPATTLQPRHQANHVSWEETAAAHLFSAKLPGN